MLEGMGHPVTRDSLERIGINYDFGKKTFYIYLFYHVKDNPGNVVEIMRDNNIEERSHRWSRMHIRRRTGRTKTTNDMAQYGALTAIFSNLESETYVNEILSDVKDFIRLCQEYIKITDTLLRANGNVLFIGKMLDDWEYEGKLKKKYSGVAKVPASTKQAAEIFLFNIPSWKDTEFVKENCYYDILRIESELKGMVKMNDDRKTIEWEIRQVVLN